MADTNIDKLEERLADKDRKTSSQEHAKRDMETMSNLTPKKENTVKEVESTPTTQNTSKSVMYNGKDISNISPDELYDTIPTWEDYRKSLSGAGYTNSQIKEMLKGSKWDKAGSKYDLWNKSKESEDVAPVEEPSVENQITPEVQSEVQPETPTSEVTENNSNTVTEPTPTSNAMEGDTTSVNTEANIPTTVLQNDPRYGRKNQPYAGQLPSGKVPSTVLQNDPRYNRKDTKIPHYKEYDGMKPGSKIGEWFKNIYDKSTNPENNVTMSGEYDTSEPSLLDKFNTPPEKPEEPAPQPVASGEDNLSAEESDISSTLDNQIDSVGTSAEGAANQGKIASNQIKDIDIPRRNLETNYSILKDPNMSGAEKLKRVTQNIAAALNRGFGGNARSYSEQLNDSTEQKYRELVNQQDQDSYDTQAGSIKSALNSDLARYQSKFDTKTQAYLDQFASRENQVTMDKVLTDMLDDGKNWFENFKDKNGNFDLQKFAGFANYVNAMNGNNDLLSTLIGIYGQKPLDKTLQFFGLNEGGDPKSLMQIASEVSSALMWGNPLVNQAKGLYDIGKGVLDSRTNFNNQKEDLLSGIANLQKFDNPTALLDEYKKLAEEIKSGYKLGSIDVDEAFFKSVQTNAKNNMSGAEYNNLLNQLKEYYKEDKSMTRKIEKAIKKNERWDDIPEVVSILSDKELTSVEKMQELNLLNASNMLTPEQYKSAYGKLLTKQTFGKLSKDTKKSAASNLRALAQPNFLNITQAFGNNYNLISSIVDVFKNRGATADETKQFLLDNLEEE